MVKSSQEQQVLIESWVFKEEEDKWVRDDQWMTKDLLQAYTESVESEEKIAARGFSACG